MQNNNKTMMENILLQGDCLEKMKELESESIDLVCTDPPYGYSFMGKDWDKAVPSVEVWKECLRVMKAGAFAFVMSAPRQDVLSRMIINLEDAGFRMDFTSIYWTYASGFPKAHNIGKAVDKKLGAKREKIKTTGSLHKNDTSHGWKDTNEALQDSNIPASPEAKALEGSYGGFQPKPAVEIIIVAMKPLSEKTFVDQAMSNGKGITWLDDCRVPYESEGDKEKTKVGHVGKPKFNGKDYNNGLPSPDLLSTQNINNSGRFPANLLVSDDVLNDGKDKRSAGIYKTKDRENKIFGNSTKLKDMGGLYNDSGSYSRYFDIDKWADNMIKKLPESVQKTYPFMITPKASKSEKNKGCEGLEEKIIARSNQAKAEVKRGNDPRKSTDNESTRYTTAMKNNHPTCKPLKLMSYLITLGSRPDDIVLDPFCGSGTTCIAAKMLNRKYIGCELSDEYIKIAQARLGAVPNTLF